MLDQNRTDYFPHLTPSNTGMQNIRAILDRLEPRVTEVCYVTRTYLTRHGAGPFPTECSMKELGLETDDSTNIPNPFQGTLRYGLLDTEALLGRIREDFDGKLPGAACSLAVTHLNETGGCPENLREQFGRLYVSDGEESGSVRISGK